jgi:site-specific DNA-cytosine methylase
MVPMSEKELLESGWSEKVSNDPKHRPQVLDRPSTTVRKEWCRRPQEAHVAEGTKYRRLSVAEVARIQSFPQDWVEVEALGNSSSRHVFLALLLHLADVAVIERQPT